MVTITQQKEFNASAKEELSYSNHKFREFFGSGPAASNTLQEVFKLKVMNKKIFQYIEGTEQLSGS